MSYDVIRNMTEFDSISNSYLQSPQYLVQPKFPTSWTYKSISRMDWFHIEQESYRGCAAAAPSWQESNKCSFCEYSTTIILVSKCSSHRRCRGSMDLLKWWYLGLCGIHTYRIQFAAEPAHWNCMYQPQPTTFNHKEPITVQQCHSSSKHLKPLMVSSISWFIGSENQIQTS